MDYRLYLKHYGVLGMHWGVRKDALERTAYRVGAKANPRELQYKVRKKTTRVNENVRYLAKVTQKEALETGVLPTNNQALKAVESVGIQKHSEVQYENLSPKDIERLKTYTDSARYSRSVNGYLATGAPPNYAERAQALRDTLQKNQIDNLTVYRSCNLKFSVNGIAKKLDSYSEEELKAMTEQLSKNFNGKSIREARVWSTSTSPKFAIDTWRAVNPTAATTYNTYLIINCKNTPGVLADATTKTGKSLVNTRSNQEAILAPNKLTYRKLAYDEERQMFAITVDAG